MKMFLLLARLTVPISLLSVFCIVLQTYSKVMSPLFGARLVLVLSIITLTGFITQHAINYDAWPAFRSFSVTLIAIILWTMIVTMQLCSFLVLVLP